MARTRWHWLADLVRREADRQHATPAGENVETRPALSDAVQQLGWHADEIIDGLAAVLATTPGKLRQPDPRTAREIDPHRLAVVLGVLLTQRDDGVRAIAGAWLRCPAVAYHLPAITLERWLRQGGPGAALFSGRIAAEGLALLGPDALRRLAAAAADQETRAAAKRWVSRFG
ncbi:MAG: hypothetical protein JKY37_23560 [Nannocystaceae bacterium]|nr:hypothetical protein [Nannocystaceae bacterium]